MVKIRDVLQNPLFILTACVLFFAGCSQQATTPISGIWRSEDALAAKNLVIEFVPDGSGQVFSGSIIGLPAEASFDWKHKGNQIEIETTAEEPVLQTMTVLSQEERMLVVKVNRTELTLVRVDDAMDEDTFESIP